MLSAYKQCIERALANLLFWVYNRVLTQTKGAEFQILSYLCSVLRTRAGARILVLWHKDNKLLSACRDFKGLDDFKD